MSQCRAHNIRECTPEMHCIPIYIFNFPFRFSFILNICEEVPRPFIPIQSQLCRPARLAFQLRKLLLDAREKSLLCTFVNNFRAFLVLAMRQQIFNPHPRSIVTRTDGTMHRNVSKKDA